MALITSQNKLKRDSPSGLSAISPPLPKSLLLMPPPPVDVFLSLFLESSPYAIWQALIHPLRWQPTPASLSALSLAGCAPSSSSTRAQAYHPRVSAPPHLRLRTTQVPDMGLGQTCSLVFSVSPTSCTNPTHNKSAVNTGRN